ncbi:hypothetical protein GOP47_0004881 [Adiantum capillus-veneris]|uniref:Mediator complex subunit 15 KIX domain-containing protein n=1 Tax=Adiantum capillus-veneris TaxID=13818 RepID=A0A9D4ZMP5_ADICA|nr:hypothetical protein GOP47_0004881 [Adiantum capillus-veneris]
METNWRAGLAQDSRNKNVSRIMETLQRHTPLTGQDGMSELWKIANRFEEEIFYAASDQHDYLRKISLEMLNLETRTQNALNSGALPTSSAGPNQSSVRPSESGVSQVQSRQQVVQPAQDGVLNNGMQASASGQASSFSNLSQQAPVLNVLGQSPSSLPALNGGPLANGGSVGPADSAQQMGQAGGMDQADIVWSKMQTLKEKYFDDMQDLLNMLATRSTQQMPQEQLQKLNHYKTVLERMRPYLLASKGTFPKEFKQDKVEAFEKQIVNIMETFKRKRQRHHSNPP